MRLTTLITIFLISLNSLAFAQEVKVLHKTSPLIKLENGTSMHSFQCFNDDGGVLTGNNFFKGMMVRKIQGYEMNYFDSDLKLKNNFIYNKKNSIIISSFIKDNIIYLIEARFELFGKGVDIFMSTSPLDAINFEEKKLFTATSKHLLNKIAQAANYGNGNSSIGVSLSKDKEKFLINFEESNKSDTKYHFYLYDLEANLVFKQSATKNKKDKKLDFQNVYFDDVNQSAYFLLKIKSSKKKEGGKYSYEYFKVSKDEVISKALDVGDKYFPYLKAFKIKDSPAFLGIYSNDNDKKGAGVVFYKLNATTLDVEVTNFNGFTEQYFTDKYGKDKDKETKNVFINSIGIFDDSILVNAEEYYTKGEEQMDQPTFSFYKDIIALKLDTEGNLIWSRNIDKYQGSASDDEHLSYKTIFKDGNSHLILNNSRSANYLKTGRLKLKGNLTEKCEMLVLTINSDGEFSGRRVLDTKVNSWPYRTNETYKNQEPNSIHLIGRNGKKWQLLKLSL